MMYQYMSSKTVGVCDNITSISYRDRWLDRQTDRPMDGQTS